MLLLYSERINQMVLNADAINRHSLRAEVAYQVEQGVRFGVESFGVEVVNVELRCGIGLASKLKRHSNVVLTDTLHPERVAERPVLLKRFVHNVPGRNHSAIPTNKSHDVLPKDRDHFGASEVSIPEPSGNLLVPHQRVATHLHVVRRRKPY